MNKTLRNLTYSAMSLALCLVLPFFTGQIPQIGAMLCPMHLPVLLAGFLCGPAWAGAEAAATGENPVIVACRTADIIVGPIGILVADAMLGEITEKMTLAISRAGAKKVLLPVNQCGNLVAGTQNLSLSRVMEEAVEAVRSLL